MSQCEKIIEKLKEELKMSEQERMRLFQYKQNKAQRLSELEEQVKKIDISDHINISKVIDQLRQKDKELYHLKSVERNFTAHASMIQNENQKNDMIWQRKYFKEVELKNQAVQKLGQLQDEMRQLEQGHTQASLSLKEVESYDWKQKCKEMFDICKGLTEENAELLRKIKILQSNQEESSGGGSINIVTVQGNLQVNQRAQKLRTTRNLGESFKQEQIGLSKGVKEANNIFSSQSNIYSNT